VIGVIVALLTPLLLAIDPWICLMLVMYPSLCLLAAVPGATLFLIGGFADS
jgi:hypothetical protein